jgi:hypothetical protein
MPSLTEEQARRYYQLEAKAMENFMDSHDFKPQDWLIGLDRLQWLELDQQIITGQNKEISTQQPQGVFND